MSRNVDLNAKGIPSVASSTQIADLEVALQRPAKWKTTLRAVPKGHRLQLSLQASADD